MPRISKSKMKRTIKQLAKAQDFRIYLNPPLGIELSISARCIDAFARAVPELAGRSLDAMSAIAGVVRPHYRELAGMEVGQMEIVTNIVLVVAVSGGAIFVDSEPFFPFED